MSRSPEVSRGSLLLLLILALAGAFLFQGARGLYETTEGRYAEVGREMLATGDWLVPTLDGHPHLTKPPLYYWMIAASLRLVGHGTYAARLPGALAFFACVWLVYALGSSLWDRRAGMVSGLIYASSLLPAMGGASVSTDMVLAMWELAAVLCYVRANRADGRRFWVALMWLAWALAFMTKGPPGLLPLLVLIVFHVWARRRPGRLVSIEGLLLFIVVGFSWYVYVSSVIEGQLGRFLGEEVVGRVASDRFGRNPQWYMGPVIYLPTLLIGMGAWVFAGLRLMRTHRLYRPSMLWARLAGRDTAAFLLIWLIVPLIVFMISRSRLPLYVLPLYAPIALAVGRYVVDWPRARMCAIVMTAVIVAMKGAAPLVPSRSDMAALHADVARLAPAGAQVLLYEEAEYHGLQFYLEGALKRVSDDGSHPWADLTTAQLVAGDVDEPWVVIARAKKMPHLVKLLARGGVEVERYAVGGYEIVVCPGPR